MRLRSTRHRIAEPPARGTAPQASSEKLLTRKETARALGISIRSLDGLVSNKTIPSVRAGRRRLFDIRDVIGALKSESDSEEDEAP